MLYSIFKVYDYKGGEFTPTVNVNKKGLIAEFCEEIDYDLHEEETDVEKIKKYFKTFEIKKLTYANFDREGWTGEIYKHVDNSLVVMSDEELYKILEEYMIEYSANREHYWDTSN